MTAGFRTSGGEGGILKLPFPASADESCTYGIIHCICEAYKQSGSSATVSIVSLIRCISAQNGISGISSLLFQKELNVRAESLLQRRLNGC